MKNKLNTSLWVILFTLFSYSGLQAQNLVVTLNNSSTETFPVANIQSIKFGAETMILNELDGTVTTWNIADIDNYAFDGSANIEGTVIEPSSVEIFPNPSSDRVHIAFMSAHAGTISIDIMDAQGKIVAQVYHGMHEGKNTYSWQCDVPSGTFFCRITTAQKVVTKPIIIQ